MQLSPHLVFDGQCREAFGFYEEVLNGEVLTMLTYGESPMAAQVAQECHERIVHATLRLGSGLLSGVDALPGTYEKPQGFYVLLQPQGAPESERVFNRLAQRGKVTIPFQSTFWSPAYGSLVDRFGVPWEISGEDENQVSGVR